MASSSAPFCLPGSFLAGFPQWWTAIRKCKENKPFQPQVAFGHCFITTDGQPGTGGQAAQIPRETLYIENKAEILSFLYLWAPGVEVGAENWDGGFVGRAPLSCKTQSHLLFLSRLVVIGWVFL